MQRLPLSTQTFEELRQQGLVYVNKTYHVHALVSEGAYYFLSRPRRFGKSLLLSTLKAYFEGKRDLFEGLYLYDREKAWQKHPVVHLDYYSAVKYQEGGQGFEASQPGQTHRAAGHRIFKPPLSGKAKATP
ncbi:MAG: AAA family ATPase [Saprospiraceae bacterium]|nr:AAA family ATPase [Saprospiraceae bacterium]